MGTSQIETVQALPVPYIALPLRALLNKLTVPCSPTTMLGRNCAPSRWHTLLLVLFHLEASLASAEPGNADSRVVEGNGDCPPDGQPLQPPVCPLLRSTSAYDLFDMHRDKSDGTRLHIKLAMGRCRCPTLL